MTLQSFKVLYKIKHLSKNSDTPLRFDSDGMIYPFTADTPFADCTKYKKEIISIMDYLRDKEYITIKSKYIRLTQDGIHFWQKILNLIWKTIYEKFIPFCALILSIISFLKSFGYLNN